jgi:subtilisin family serine protease
MPAPRRLSHPAWCAVLALLALAPPAFADKVSPWVLEHGAGAANVEFLVIMADQADLKPAAQLTSRIDKAYFVRDALYSKATRTQAPLLQWLRDRGVEYRSFYIVNAIWVKGPLSLAQAIAERSDVARIDGNPVIQNLAPVTPTPEELRAVPDRAQSPQAIEPGVTNIRAPEVWNAGTTGQGIVVGGADTGVQWDHPALINHYRGWAGGPIANHNYNWHDSIHGTGTNPCGYDSPVPCDDNNHGTHTLGTAVGSDAGKVNQIGVAPGAQFIACRNMDQGNGTPARYLECMEWFLAPYPIGGTPAQGDPTRAPDITTNSWACPPDEGCNTASLQQGVEAQRAAGIMFVAAAENGGPSCSTISDPPSFYDATFTVGAHSASTNLIASFSSRGPVTADGSNRIKPDLTAPGVSVRSCIPGNTYATFSGTSMATPHVAGAIALLWSARPGLRHNIAATEEVLDNTAVHVSSTVCSPGGGYPNNTFGWGRIDVKAAYDQLVASVLPDDVPAAHNIWLGPALPNPGHRSTLLRFRLDSATHVDLAIFSIGGERRRTLLRGEATAGDHALRWEGLDDAGRALPAGMYLVRLESAGAVASRKMIWLGI